MFFVFGIEGSKFVDIFECGPLGSSHLFLKSSNFPSSFSLYFISFPVY